MDCSVQEEERLCEHSKPLRKLASSLIGPQKPEAPFSFICKMGLAATRVVKNGQSCKSKEKKDMYAGTGKPKNQERVSLGEAFF